MWGRKDGNAMVLCLDDDPTVLATRKLVLQSAGYRVVTASNAREGLDIFSRQPIRAVVIDYAMTETEATDVAAEMKRRDSGVPILMLSPYMYLPESVLRNVDACLAVADGPAAMLQALEALLVEKRMSLGAA